MPIQSKQQPPYYESKEKTKSYKALLTQTGTNAPTAIKLQDDFDGIWARANPGEYTYTKMGAFPENKLFIPLIYGGAALTYQEINNLVSINLSRTNDNMLTLNVQENSTPADEWLNNTPIEFYLIN